MDKQISENGVIWYLFSEDKCPYLDKLIEIYKVSKKEASVIYANNKGSGRYYKERIVLHEFSDGGFTINKYVRKYGISKTSIIYHRESISWSIRYNDKTKAIYLKTGSTVRHLTLSSLSSTLHCYGNDSLKNNVIYKYLEGRFGWLRNFVEDSSYMGLVSFTTIMRKKLFNRNKVLKHIFGVNQPVINNLINEKKFRDLNNDSYHTWREVKDVLINIDNLKPEFYYSQFFIDTCRFAKQLGYKINCSWGLNRLKEEHDKWSKEITNIILKHEDLKELNIKKVFRLFHEFSGYELLLTNHDLIEEGRRMNHCVATYSNSVNNGTCAIFRVDGYTLSVSYGNKNWFGKTEEEELFVSQLRGFKNSSPPEELIVSVERNVVEFNRYIKRNNIKIDKGDKLSKMVEDVFMGDFF